MLYAGSFEPAYILTITALATQLQPVTNKRNAALLSKAMDELLGVNPARGTIKFMSVPEENLASGGRTVADLIEEAGKDPGHGPLGGVQRTLSRGSRQSREKKSVRSLDEKLPNVTESPPDPIETYTVSVSAGKSPQRHAFVKRSFDVPMPPIPTEPSDMDRKAEKVQKMGRRKSFIATIFGKT